jgi:hypothetical protein
MSALDILATLDELSRKRTQTSPWNRGTIVPYETPKPMILYMVSDKKNYRFNDDNTTTVW